MTKAFVHKAFANFAHFGAFVSVLMFLRSIIFAIKGQNNQMARRDRRCMELHRPGKTEERNEMGNEATEMLVSSTSIWLQESHEELWVYDQSHVTVARTRTYGG